MKKIGLIVLLAACCVAWTGPVAEAKDTKVQKAPADQVTQCELARLMINVLGLARFLPPSPSCQQCFAMLLGNSMSPSDGWNPDAIVTKAVLARLIVQAMGKEAEVKNPNDPQSYIAYLKGIGVPIDTIGAATDELGMLEEPVAPQVYVATVDPLSTPKMFNPLDEQQFGADMAGIARLLTEIEFVPPPAPPAPTPAPKPKPKPTPRPRHWPLTRD